MRRRQQRVEDFQTQVLFVGRHDVTSVAAAAGRGPLRQLVRLGIFCYPWAAGDGQCSAIRSTGNGPMDTLAKRLDKKLREWSPETAEQVRSQVAEIIELADQGLLDIVRSRKVEQEVLDHLDEPATR